MDNFESVEVYNNDLFNTSIRLLVFGASNSGKTYLVQNLVRLHHSKFHKIVVCGTRNKLLDFKETCYITQHYNPPQKAVRTEYMTLFRISKN